MIERERVEKAIRENAKGGKIPCVQCMRIADEFEIPRKELGKILNEMKIKVSHCQLGCFE